MSVKQLINFDLLVFINFKSLVLSKISISVLCIFLFNMPSHSTFKNIISVIQVAKLIINSVLKFIQIIWYHIVTLPQKSLSKLKF